jgi:hypothetical protein
MAFDDFVTGVGSQPIVDLHHLPEGQIFYDAKSSL